MWLKNVLYSVTVLFLLAQRCYCNESAINMIEECDDDENANEDPDVATFELIKFYLITPENTTVELNSTNLGLLNTTNPTKILIHGLGSYGNSLWIDKVAYNYHSKSNYNVIAVDWSVISSHDRVFVLSAIDAVGNIIGNFIIQITEGTIQKLGQIHLIGSSVGAQISAAAGKTVSEKGQGKVDRITALDPTEPENFNILNETDAGFVDVIHTTRGVGERQIGTVDFYVTSDDPNRPICVNHTCGKLLATEYFSDSIINADRYYAISCQNTSVLCDAADKTEMGEFVYRNASGSYLVRAAALSTHYFEKYVMSITAAVILRYLVNF